VAAPGTVLTLHTVFQEHLTVSTQGHGDMHDLTEQVEDILTRSPMRAGLVHLFNADFREAKIGDNFTPLKVVMDSRR
jgi:hypothetical protein